VLNPGFSPEANESSGSRYVVPAALSAAIVGANSEYATGAELRTQPAYGDELWLRMRQLGVDRLPWGDLRVLDACCGSGFLSFHVLQRVRPRSLTMLDVSPNEVRAAEELVAGLDAGDANVEAVCRDLAEAPLEGGQYDVAMGNSFLHHFPAVPDVLATIFGLLKPGGVFIGLHEPTPAALPWESGDVRQVAAYFLAPRRYLTGMRHQGPGPVREGTTDVWIFEARELRRLLEEQGFTDVRVLPRYVLRPFVVALLRMHLDERKPRLSRLESALLLAAVRMDSLLRRVLPKRAFGGLSFVARRPS
jgi:SAM-dependent methyltransferase